jgi:hypothetical protein
MLLDDTACALQARSVITHNSFTRVRRATGNRSYSLEALRSAASIGSSPSATDPTHSA